MRISVPLDDLPVGEPIAENIFDLQGRLLLSKGNELSEGFVNRLKVNGVDRVLVEGLAGEKLSKKEPGLKIPEFVGRNVGKLNNLYSDLLYEFDRVKLRGSYIKPLQMELQPLMSDMVETVSEDYVEVLDFVLKRKQKVSHYNFSEHHINTCMLAIVLAKRMGLNSNIVKEVATVALLHDIGELRIPPKILLKSGSLTQEELEIVRTHPLRSMDILNKTSWVGNRELFGVVCHHERLDGKGYPIGYTDSKILIHSRIVSAVSIFNTATSDKEYANKKPVLNVLLELRDRSEGELDTRVTNLIYNLVTKYMQKENKSLLLENQEKAYLTNHRDRILLDVKGTYFDLKDPKCPKILQENFV